MATNLVRFEVVLPEFNGVAAHDTTIQNFLNSMETLGLLTITQSFASDNTYKRLVFGTITTAQEATALGYLNTLNAALGTNVLCIAWLVTSQP